MHSPVYSHSPVFKLASRTTKLASWISSHFGKKMADEEKEHRDKVQNAKKFDEIKRIVGDIREDIQSRSASPLIIAGIIVLIIVLGYTCYKVNKIDEHIIQTQQMILQKVDDLHTDITTRIEKMEREVKGEVTSVKSSCANEMRSILNKFPKCP